MEQIKQGYIVVYTDEGPTGICAQCMSITCPHCYIYLFDTEEEAREYMAITKIGRNGRKKQNRTGDLSRGNPVRFFDARKLNKN